MARINSQDSEHQPLLPVSNDGTSHSSASSRFHGFITSDIGTDHGDIALIGLYLVTGLLDSSSILIWNSFVSVSCI